MAGAERRALPLGLGGQPAPGPAAPRPGVFPIEVHRRRTRIERLPAAEAVCLPLPVPVAQMRGQPVTRRLDEGQVARPADRRRVDVEGIERDVGRALLVVEGEAGVVAAQPPALRRHRHFGRGARAVVDCRITRALARSASGSAHGPSSCSSTSRQK